MPNYTLDWSNAGANGTFATGSGNVSIASTTTAAGRTANVGVNGNPATEALWVSGLREPVSTTITFDSPVTNLSFELFDVDSKGSTWDDKVTVIATDANGNQVPITVSDLDGLHSVADGNVINADGNASGGVETTGADDSVTVAIAGPITSLTIIFDNGESAQNTGIIGLSDISYDLPPDYIVEGTSGDDVIDASYAGDPEGDMVDNNDAADGSNDDVIQAGAGNDQVFGGDGNDTIHGGEGDDTLLGGSGDDTFVVENGFGNDTIDGEETGETHGDTLDLSAVTDDLTIDLTNATAGQGSFGDGTSTSTYTEIEHIILSGGKDTLVLADGSGNDTVEDFDGPTDNGDGSFTGNDMLDVSSLTSDGGTTPVDVSDVVVSDDGNGNAVLSFPGGETLTLIGVAPADLSTPESLVAIGIPPAPDYIVEGTSGDDVIDASYTGDPEGDMVDNNDAADGSNDDVIQAGAGDDQIVAGQGNDTIYGDEGDDTINAGDGDDIIHGGAGVDTVEAGAGDDTFYGGDGNDWINGDYGDDILYGGAGDDYLRGSYGNDTIYSGEGDDYLWGGWGDDTFIIENGFGNDTIDAEDQDQTNGDTLDLSAVTDDLTIDLTNGATGHGSFSDGTSTSTYTAVEHIILSGGKDTLVLADGSGNDTVQDFTGPTDNGDGSFTGNDMLDVSNLTSDGDTTPVDVHDVVVSDDGSGNAVLTFPGGETLTLIGVAPADLSTPASLVAIGIPPGSDGVVTGTSGDDFINNGYAGDNDGDFIDHGDAVLPGETGDDDIVQAGDGNDTVYSGQGNDEVHGGTGDDTVFGGTGDDEIFGEDGYDELYGEDGEDTISGGAGDDTITGGAGADTLSGGDGADSFLGGTAGDVVDGGEGGVDNDTLDLTGAGPLHIIYDPNNPENGTVEFRDDQGNVTGTMTFENIENVIPCFTPGTLIATAHGQRPVEELRPGDRVITRDNGIQEICWAGNQRLSGQDLWKQRTHRPILVPKGALGNNMPERDMLVSPNHRFLVANERTSLLLGETEVFVAAKHLLDREGVQRVDCNGVDYIHFMFEQHEVVLSDGCWTESFQPGDQSLRGVDRAQRSEIFSLFPELQEAEGLAAYKTSRITLKRHEAQLVVG